MIDITFAMTLVGVVNTLTICFPDKATLPSLEINRSFYTVREVSRRFSFLNNIIHGLQIKESCVRDVYRETFQNRH